MIRLSRLAAEEISFTFNKLQYRLGDGRRNGLRKVLVNGSPKTGTTWMYRMICTVPGYRPAGNFKGRLAGYLTVEPGMVVHGHDWYTPELIQILAQNPLKVILMLRDPRDQTVSHMFHLLRDSAHPWHERISAMDQAEALTACIEGRPGDPDLPGINDFLGMTNSWVSVDSPAISIRYESLQADPFTHMQAVFRYLEIEVRPAMIEAIIQRNRFERMTVGRKVWKMARRPGQEDSSSHFRKGIIGDWKNYFQPAHIHRFKEVAGQALIEMGYEKDLEWR